MWRVRPQGPDAHVPLTWRRVLLAVMSYCLFFTDVPRSGVGLSSLPYPAATSTLCSYFGPYAYLVVDIARTASGTFFGKTSAGASTTTTVWSYKYDTCSIGMRTFVQTLNISHWHPCLLYEEACAGMTLEISAVFRMLDNFVDSLVETQTSRVEYFFHDSLSDYFSFGQFSNKQHRTVRSHYIDAPVDICDPQLGAARPYFCQEIWANFATMGSKKVSAVSSHIQSRMRLQRDSMDSSVQRLDMVIVDSIQDTQNWVGGFSIVSSSSYDVVTVLRVQNCSDVTKQRNCTTVRLVDYRYEGGAMSTNVVYWFRLVRLLRIAAQSYNVLRVVCLFAGCYAAAAPPVPSKTAKVIAACASFFRIPTQVVIYGSWCPVALFAIAHAIDSTALYFTIVKSFSALDGMISSSLDNVMYLITMLTCHMRNVWVLSFIAKMILYWADRYNRRGVLGVRGYILPLISLLSIVFDVRWNGARNTNLVLSGGTVGSPSEAFARQLKGLPHDVRYSGLILDMRNFIVAFVVVRIGLYFSSVTSVLARSAVPSVAVAYANPSMFSTSWKSLFVDSAEGSISPAQMQPSTDHLTRPPEHRLMNITWMTDPIECAALYLWSRPRIFCYRHKATGTLVYHPLGWDELKRVEEVPTFSAMYEFHSETMLTALPWRDRIECF
ncbi:hypothetical protein ACHHYP_13713 [Achlya hypogyna]|uniref:Transmembrane protein n=1 Tax=Achlya hypogyna TaxID=1202772 RepID=A0A1V9YES9_ACHHY|nr:hypothetical protein ACHHYP_13713 [Achlya hypogyna]